MFIEDHGKLIVPPPEDRTLTRKVHLSADKHRIGRFEIPREIIERDQFALLPLFARVVVFRCEYQYYKDTFVYDALSPDFEETILGWPPWYIWSITDGVASFSLYD